MLTAVSVARCYGHLIRAGVPGGDGAGTAMPAAALDVAFSWCRVSAFEKVDLIADLDGIVRGRA